MKTLKNISFLLAFACAIPLCASEESEAEVLENIFKQCPTAITAVQELIKQFEESEQEYRYSQFKEAHPISVTIQKDAIVFACKGARSIITVKNRGYCPDDLDNVIELYDSLYYFENPDDPHEKYITSMRAINDAVESYGVHATVYLDIKGCLTKKMCTNGCNIDDEYMGIMAAIIARTMAPFDSIENLILVSETEEEYTSCLKLGLHLTQHKQINMIEKDGNDLLNAQLNAQFRRDEALCAA